MARIYDKELAEVRNFMDGPGRTALLVEFQQIVVQTAKQFASEHDLKGRVHEVFSRADTDEPIKSVKKIAIKLHKWRKTNPGARVSDLHDLIGVTVTCLYPSDIAAFCQYLESNKSRYEYDFHVHEDRLVSRDDYVAKHYELHGDGKFRGLKCELQVKTVMSKDWGLKTHDLVYKPPGDIDRRLGTHIEKLGHVLRIIDDQSEIVRDLIEAAWKLDQRRRDAARKSLLSEFPNTLPQHARELLDKWKSGEDVLAVASVRSGEVRAFDYECMSYVDTHGLDVHVCRIACLYALSRGTRDRHDFALDYIDRLLASFADGSVERKRGLGFQCNALMALGEYEECLQRSAKVIEIAEKDGEPEPLVTARLNHAYYLSEACYHRAFDEAEGGGSRTRAESDQCGVDALKTVRELQSDVLNSDKRLQLIDTVGAVLICCGTSEVEVREGLELCREAYNASRGTPAFDTIGVFFALHERRAYSRLLQFD